MFKKQPLSELDTPMVPARFVDALVPERTLMLKSECKSGALLEMANALAHAPEVGDSDELHAALAKRYRENSTSDKDLLAQWVDCIGRAYEIESPLRVKC